MQSSPQRTSACKWATRPAAPNFPNLHFKRTSTGPPADASTGRDGSDGHCFRPALQALRRADARQAARNVGARTGRETIDAAPAAAKRTATAHQTPSPNFVCRPYFAEGDRQRDLPAMRGRQTILSAIFCGKWPATGFAGHAWPPNHLVGHILRKVAVKTLSSPRRCSGDPGTPEWFPGGRFRASLPAGFLGRKVRPEVA